QLPSTRDWTNQSTPTSPAWFAKNVSVSGGIGRTKPTSETQRAMSETTNLNSNNSVETYPGYLLITSELIQAVIPYKNVMFFSLMIVKRFVRNPRSF
ncbi:MAG: hypothetical protein DMF04_04545, partial [Verrucomicrobia bacterium]